MSEFKQERERANHVSLGEYEASKAWRADAEELAEPLRDLDEEDKVRGRFTMRLLERDRSGARDQLVEVVGADSLASDSLAGPLAVTVRPLTRDGEKGRLQTHHVAADGMILNATADTSDIENGYFVGGEGIQEKIEEDFDMVRRVPVEKPALKAIALPLPHEQETPMTGIRYI